MLEEEFDICQQLGSVDLKKFPDLTFHSVAKKFALKFKGKFVFVDCNCMILKNSDELFHKNEMVQIAKRDQGQRFIALAVVASTKRRQLKNLDYGTILEIFVI
jgi:hypothetical protein